MSLQLYSISKKHTEILHSWHFKSSLMFSSSFNNGANFPFLAASLLSLFFFFGISWNYLDLTFKHSLLQDTELRWCGRCCWWGNERADITIRMRILSALALMRTQQSPGTTINIDPGSLLCPVPSQDWKSVMLSGHTSPQRTDCLPLCLGGGRVWTTFSLSTFPAITFMAQLGLSVFCCWPDRDTYGLLLPHTPPHQREGNPNSHSWKKKQSSPQT